MRTAIVTTTINVPVGLTTWARQLKPGDVMIVAGDRKTPHDEVLRLLERWAVEFGIHTPYLYAGSEQDRYDVAPLIGWNTIQRRNLATLEALRYRPDFIFTVDDDNFPERGDHVRRVLDVLRGDAVDPLVEVSAPSGWFNAGALLKPAVVHRGFPQRYRLDREVTTRAATTDSAPVGVHASLWLGAPDIDAAERWHHDPETFAPAPTTVQLAPDTWCPFNSQATAYRGELAPLLMVPPGLGRYDDIWGSYVARRIMDVFGWTVAYGAPYVRQERNPHDVVRDLEQELYGMRHTDAFVLGLRSLELDGAGKTVLDVLGDVTTALATLDYLPEITRRFMPAWVRDVRRVMEEAPLV